MILDTMPYNFENFTENQFQTIVDYDTDKIITENFLNSDLILTESQNELVEKFNAAFVEAQNPQKSTPNFPQTTEIIENFTNIFHGGENFEALEGDSSPLLDSENSNFLLDIYLSKEQESGNEVESYSSSNIECSSQSSYFNLEDAHKNYGFVYDNDDTMQESKSSFFIPPPFKPFSTVDSYQNFENSETIEDTSGAYENFDDLGLSDIDFCENLSNSSFDIETITTELCESENYDFDYENTCIKTEKKPEKPKDAKQFVLPSVTTFGKHFAEKKYMELDNFIRNSPANTINIFAQVN